MAVAGLMCLALLPLHAQTPPPDPAREYALKSVFLYNFCRFIEWPSKAFASPTEPLIIGVIGQDPFGSLLEEAVQGESLRGRPIRIEHYREPREAVRCHLLFISRSEMSRLNQILAAVAGRSVVTVGESDAFLERGGMIALTTEENRVRLRINPNRLRGASVDVSSKLLRVADIKT
jgi:hypothetical protein